MIGRALIGLALPACIWAQSVCPSAIQLAPCESVFDVPATVEFRSPHNETALVKAFNDGGSKWIVRFTPAESGSYAYRVNGGAEGSFNVSPSDRPGLLRAANVHHFAFEQGTKLTPHLWMATIVPGFGSMDRSRWNALVDRRSAQHFNHMGITLVDEASTSTSASAFRTPEFFHAAEAKIAYANRHGIIVDIAFFGPNGLLDCLLPQRAEREAWFTMAISRLAAYDVTWQGLEGWETYDHPRDLLKEINEYLTAQDTYKHPRSSRTLGSTGGFVNDDWLRYRSFQTGEFAVDAIEQATFLYPAVNNFSNGITDSEVFRHRLWNSAMSGQYPDAEVPDEDAANAMKNWYSFMSESRHWETEPFFDVENGRGLALEGIEYLIYVEKPGPVTVHIEDHRYDVAWFNPVNGQWTKIKEVKGEVFTGEPPDRSHDWVLRISREGEKRSMLNSVKFDSRVGGIVLQDVEANPEKVPFDVAEPAGDAIRSGARYAVRLTRHSKAIDRMIYEWTGEVTVDNRLYRILGTGAEGTLRIPENIAAHYPAAIHIRITGMNGLGKVYTLDRNYQLTK